MRPTFTFFRAFVLPIALLIALQGRAMADKADKLVKQMTSASDYKVRLSAALNLAKMNNRRAGFLTACRRNIADR